jgi:hypothetical protein
MACSRPAALARVAGGRLMPAGPRQMADLQRPFELFVGAAFSLWRAEFLASPERIKALNQDAQALQAARPPRLALEQVTRRMSRLMAQLQAGPPLGSPSGDLDLNIGRLRSAIDDPDDRVEGALYAWPARGRQDDDRDAPTGEPLLELQVGVGGHQHREAFPLRSIEKLAVLEV